MNCLRWSRSWRWNCTRIWTNRSGGLIVRFRLRRSRCLSTRVCLRSSTKWVARTWVKCRSSSTTGSTPTLWRWNWNTRLLACSLPSPTCSSPSPRPFPPPSSPLKTHPAKYRTSVSSGSSPNSAQMSPIAISYSTSTRMSLWKIASQSKWLGNSPRQSQDSKYCKYSIWKTTTRSFTRKKLAYTLNSLWYFDLYIVQKYN